MLWSYLRLPINFSFSSHGKSVAWTDFKSQLTEKVSNRKKENLLTVPNKYQLTPMDCTTPSHPIALSL